MTSFLRDIYNARPVIAATTRCALHDVADPALYVGAVLNEHRRSGVYLTPEQWEDLGSHLKVVLYELAKRYDVVKSRSGQSFSTYAGRILRLRVADWYRHEFGYARFGSVRSTSVPIDDHLEVSDAGEDADTELSLNLAA